ncbi:MAG: iron-sulfur cluster assembly accessory protein [Methylocystaceae bacterium]|nr:MAG: iron-sulfur cluster assembly accessory protein [Methylocystaceae bacterium]
MLILTRPAVTAIENSMKLNDKTRHGVRIMAEAGGCSGPKYAMRFEQEPRDDDVVIEIRNVRVFVDEPSMNILRGATVDYSEDAENFGFNFILAQPESSCGEPGSGHSCSCSKAC